MRCTALTTLFFVLFALFSTMAYAAPVAPQGAILKRCEPGYCRNASDAPAGSGSGSNRFAMISDIITTLLALMGGPTNKTPGGDPQPTTTAVTTAPSSSVAPASNPTGV